MPLVEVASHLIYADTLKFLLSNSNAGACASMTTDAIALAPPLVGSQRARPSCSEGALLTLMNFASPAGGMIDIPVTFFLKNRMHLDANELAVFKLWIGVPLILGFVFGFIRDRWSPFGRGDRAHLVVFGVTTALVYGAMSLINPAYRVFLVGLFVATMAFRMVSSAAYGITNTIAQKHAVCGQMSSVISTAARCRIYSRSSAVGC